MWGDLLLMVVVVEVFQYLEGRFEVAAPGFDAFPDGEDRIDGDVDGEGEERDPDDSDGGFSHRSDPCG